MKTKLKPSAKTKRRYLALSTNSKQEVESIILDYIGILGWAKSAPIFLKSDSGKLILSIERSALTNVRAAFEISKSKIKILRVSGTLKGLKNG